MPDSLMADSWLRAERSISGREITAVLRRITCCGQEHRLGYAAEATNVADLALDEPQVGEAGVWTKSSTIQPGITGGLPNAAGGPPTNTKMSRSDVAVPKASRHYRLMSRPAHRGSARPRPAERHRGGPREQHSAILCSLKTNFPLLPY